MATQRESATFDFRGTHLVVHGWWYPETEHFEPDHISIGTDCDNHFSMFADSALGEDIAIAAERILKNQLGGAQAELKATGGLGYDAIREMEVQP